MACEAIVFDFFGTLVHWGEDADEAGLAAGRTHLARGGLEVAAPQLEQPWRQATRELEAAAVTSLIEFGMLDVGRRCLELLGDREPTDADAVGLGQAFLAGWRDQVWPIDNLVGFLTGLAEDHRLAIVSNTHDSGMVPAILQANGLTGMFEAVILSVDVGLRKPHRGIFDLALERLGLLASEVVYVGDSYEADYLGARSAGWAARLIDPSRSHEIPHAHRLTAVQDVRTSLGGGSGG